ncbi:hypothetical protein D3C71_1414680 [compost metagenome]
MDGEGVDGNLRRHRLQHGACLERGADADGVAQRNLIAAHGMQAHGHAHYVVQRYGALIRAAEHGGDVAAHLDAIGLGPGQDRLEAQQRLINAGVGVGAVELFRRCGEHRHFLRANGQRALVTLFVGYQHRVADAGAALDAGEDLGGIGQLRHPLRADETGGFDAEQAGGREPVDQLDLVGGADQLFFILQTIARAYFNDTDEVVHGVPGQDR